MDVKENSWLRARDTRRTRRSVLRGAAVSGAGVAGAMLLACKGSGSRSGSSSAAPTGAQAPSSTPQAGGVFNTAVDKGPDTFDPHKSVAAQTANFVSYVGSRLFRFRTGRDAKAKDDLDVESDLALTAESPDALTWTFKLRPNAKFHNIPPVNGHAVEAEDVRTTFIRALAPEAATRASLNMIDPNQIQTPDKTTVVFKLKNPYAEFKTQMASIKFSWILPREAAAGSYDPAKTPIGSGPFLFDTFTPDVAVTMKRNPDYFESGIPYLTGARIALIPDRALQAAQFTSGGLDDIRAAVSDLDTLKKNNPRAMSVTYPPSHPLLGFYQLGDPTSPFQDIRVRRAVSMAIDRDALNKVIWNGTASDMEFYVPLNMGRWSLKSNELDAGALDNYKFNLAEAKKLIEAAGGSNLNVKLAFYTPDSPEKLTTAQTVYNMLKALPWQINLVQADYAKDWLGSGKGVRYGSLAKDTIAFSSTDGLTTVDDFLYGYFYSTSPTNIVRVKDSQLDTMLDKARTIVNDDERLKAYKDVQKYLVDKSYELSAIPNGNNFNLVQPWVHGYSGNTVEDNGRMACSGAWLTK
jgi:peptide/nickel transport system substrate-binding protein